ncbi:MAG TPA: Dabb family protein [Blastocatellia bacterium]|nr:Dabb family protein [Blastocatellia bacterium]
MIRSVLFRRIMIGCVLAGVLAGAFAAGRAAGENKYGTPGTLLHVVTLRWKAESAPEQRQKAIDGIKKMAGEIPGIKNVWLRTVKVQGGTSENPYNAAFVMEFESEAALKAYADHPAHKEWEKMYLAIRDESRTHDISN